MILQRGVVITLLLLNVPLQSAIGCMDNSKHLTERFDTKAYHYVQCNCPCVKTIIVRNRCLKCQHYHDPVPLRIVAPQKLVMSRSRYGTALEQRDLKNALRRWLIGVQKES